MKENEMVFVADMIHKVLKHMEDEEELDKIRKEIRDFSKDYLIYKELI
jgi:glycine/serine hydroxymethyltransferase